MIRHRKMTRAFEAAPLPTAALDRILELAASSPSAGFTQGVEWLVVEGEERERFFEVACDEEFLAAPGPMAGLLRAPVILLPVADPSAYENRYREPDKAGSSLARVPAADWPVPYWIVDAAFGVMAALLAATDAGLGALFFRLHGDPLEVRRAFAIPEGRLLIGAIAVGYRERAAGPRGSRGRRPRRPIEEIVHRNRW